MRRDRRVFLVVGIVLLSGCSGFWGQKLSTDDRPSLNASQNVSDAFIVHNETLVVNKTLTGDREYLTDTNCYWAGVDATWAFLKQRFEGEFRGITVEMGGDEDSDPMTINRVTWENRNGTSITEPSLSYQRLKTEVPDEARITITREGETLSCHVPIEIRNGTAQYQ